MLAHKDQKTRSVTGVRMYSYVVRWCSPELQCMYTLLMAHFPYGTYSQLLTAT